MKRRDWLALTILGVIWGALIATGGSEAFIVFLLAAVACALLTTETLQTGEDKFEDMAPLLDNDAKPGARDGGKGKV